MKLETRLMAEYAGVRKSLNSVCGFALKSIEGVGIQNVQRIEQSSPSQRGASDIGYSITPREISLTWQMLAGSNVELFDMRVELLGVFNPQQSEAPVRITFTLPNATRYSIDCHLQGDLDFSTGERSGGVSQSVGVMLRAADPRFYSKNTQSYSYYPSAVARTGWKVPWPINWVLSNTSSTSSGSFSIDYLSGATNGAPEYPTIEIKGPVSSPGITNITTGQTIQLENFELSAGEVITIDLKNGQYGSETPTVRNQYGESRESNLTNDSDMNLFLAPKNYYLPASGVYSTGTNQFALLGSQWGDSTAYTIIYRNRYMGF